jgi:hypothetical protein
MSPVKIPLALFACLILTSCGSVLAELDTIVIAADAALAAVQASGVPIPVAATVYLGDVANCIGQESLSPEPTSDQLLAISGCLAKDIAPVLTGLPGTIVSLVGAVVTDVAAFLANHPPPKPARAGTRSSFTFTGSQDAKFTAIKVHAASVAAHAKAKK